MSTGKELTLSYGFESTGARGSRQLAQIEQAVTLSSFTCLGELLPEMKPPGSNSFAKSFRPSIRLRLLFFCRMGGIWRCPTSSLIR